MYSNSAESFLPGICREFIGASLAVLGQSYGDERTMADSLVHHFLRVYQGLLAISQAHDDQDEDSQDDRKHRPAVTSHEPSLSAHGTVCVSHLAALPGCLNCLSGVT